MLASLIAAALVSFAGPDPQWIAPGGPVGMPEPAPSWVWAAAPGHPAPTAQGAPSGTIRLARVVTIGEEGESPRATLALAADNHAVAYLNGVEVLRSDSWAAAAFTIVALRPGENVLAVEAINDAGQELNPAGVIAALTIPGAAGAMRGIVTDSTWRASPKAWPGFPGAAPPEATPAAVVIGPADIRPWGLSTGSFTPPRPCPLLRRSFTLDDKPTRATVRIIGLGHYELHCNGEIVGDSVVNQAWSQYDKTLYWQEFDLAPHLRAGENVLGVMLGNSFWQVAPANDAGRYTKTDCMPDFSGGRPYLLWLDASITTPAGTQAVTSDDAWTWADGPLTFSNIFAGEDYDERLEQPRWDFRGFDDGAWRHATVVAAPPGTPTALDGPALKFFEAFEPIDVKPISRDVHTYVFPQNCSALLQFTLSGGRSGSRVRFRPCEYMEPSGRVKFTYTWGTGKDIWFDYTKASVERRKYLTKFCYVGAQFVQVEGAVRPGEPNPDNLPVLHDLRLVHVRAACPQAGTFESSSAMHNGAERLIDWSIRSNMTYYPSDCPHREKCSWLEEDWHMARAMSYRYDTRAWLAKTCRDIRDTQLPDGHVPTNSPNYLVGVPPHGFWNEAPEWGVASVLVPWHLYEWYGDTAPLADNFDCAKRYVDYLASTAKDGVITSNLGDWYDSGHGKGNGPSQWTPNEVSATAIWALGADTVSKMAAVLGRADDAAKYRAVHEQVRRDFQRRFYDHERRMVLNKGSCQAANSVAICAGLVPEEDREGVLENITGDLARRGFRQTPGEVLQVFLIRALAENGRGEVLHRVYNREDIPSYGHMVASGLTTLPESWDARRGTGDSLNHFMLGHLLEWHFAYVAGIRQAPGSVGWRRILIAPQPPAVELRGPDPDPHAIRAARAALDTPRGRVESEWRFDAPTFTLRCVVPAGASATAILPDGTAHELAPGETTLNCRLEAQ